jgi:hypothetical protein
VNELERLRDEQGLCDLLRHYAELGKLDRQVWQDRVLEVEGVPARELVRWHGELIAQGWIEQNTGFTPILRKGEAPGCYRVTASGLRALKQHQAGEFEVD